MDEPTARIKVVGLGPAGVELLGEPARHALLGAKLAFLRTGRHPAAAALGPLRTFDHHYEESDTFEEVYRRIVEDLVQAAISEAGHGRFVAYGVPGSPLVAEATVELLTSDPRVHVEIVPALSFLDLAWAALGVDPVAAGVHIIDGTRFEVEAVGRSGPFLIAQCWSAEVLSRIKLALDPDATRSPRVVLLHHLGLGDQAVHEVPVAELDRSIEPDHLTTVWVDTGAVPISGAMAQLDELVRTLRERCPWDREQTHDSLTGHLVEETYEVVEAIDEVTAELGEEASAKLDLAVSHLEEELGDLLFQVMFHSRLAAEQGWFTVGDVAVGVHDKLVARHPHVFAATSATTPGEVVANWELIKAAEKGRQSVTEGIPKALPALLLAAKLQRKALALGLPDLATEQRSAELVMAIQGLGPNADADAIGAILFDVVALASSLGVDAEEALRAAAAGERDRIIEWERSGPHLAP